LDLKEIKELIALFRKNDLSEFSLEQEDFKISLKRGSDSVPVVSAQSFAPVITHQTLPAGAHAAPAAAPSASPGESSTHDIQSPMVGTFYSAPSPDSPPFVSVGQQVTHDTVICIIEAMKVMNELKAETSGTVVEVLAENGKPVQYGQPLYRLR
jgi:acetyl-CoA carboxylase biotin carboxyl carrier protein